jgi:hypothetical protein
VGAIFALSCFVRGVFLRRIFPLTKKRKKVAVRGLVMLCTGKSAGFSPEYPPQITPESAPNMPEVMFYAGSLGVFGGTGGVVLSKRNKRPSLSPS